MKKILIPLLALVLLFVSLSALAEGQEEAISLELNTSKLPAYAADDPFLDGLAAKTDDLTVLVLPVKKSLELQVSVKPKTLKNKKFDLSVDNADIVRVKGNTVTGLAVGETVLTIASQEDPAVQIQYRIAVIQPVTRIAVTASEKTVAVGGTVSLTAAYVPENATKQQVVWSSADEKIATVDENGVVTGVKRGTARITATAVDGSKIRTSISIQVNQNAEEITLDKSEVTVDVSRTAVLKATVLPKDTNDKGVIWTSSDENVAKVNKEGRVTGVALGECEIICTSKTTGDVQAKAVVRVQQPVKKITFGEAPVVYAGETDVLTWTVEPADASNQALRFTSGNEKILTVDENGTITGVSFGETYVNAVSTDGSNRQARIKVKVAQHVTGVHMYRNTAYIDVGQTSSTRAVVEPDKGTNHRMTWEIADPSIATVEQDAKEPNRAKIKGLREGETSVTVTTEDGGFQAVLPVKVGDWESSLKWITCGFDARGNMEFSVQNVSEMNITGITLEMECFDYDGKPMAVNIKTGENMVDVKYSKTLAPGKSTAIDGWKLLDYDKDKVNTEGVAAIRVRIKEFQIDNDWVKLVRKNNRQMKKTYDPHKVLR